MMRANLRSWDARTSIHVASATRRIAADRGVDVTQLPGMIAVGNGWWRLPESRPHVPVLFSLRAVRD